jgi:tetratricopeptide (TPR) repeat protein
MTLGVMTVMLLAATDAGVPVTKFTMREAFDALVRLQTATSSPAALRDPKNAASISADLAKFASLSHAFPADPKNQEPATAALSSLFSQYAAETQRRFDARETDVVAMRVRTMVGLCFTCHTRERAPVDFADAQKRLEALGLTGLQRAQVLAATRQFDEALAEYTKLLDGAPTTERGLLEYSRALQDAMALLVRVKDDSSATLALLDKLSARPDVPPFLKENLAAWKKDVTAWKAEKFDAQKAKPEALFAKAQALMAKANNGGGPFSTDERRDVTWLRASGYLNLALGKDPKLKARGEALYLLGVCAGALRSPLWWDVDLLFFEACVRENPKTKVAKRCFQQLSDRVYLGFTGSAGTFIPEDELARLTELRALAE